MDDQKKSYRFLKWTAILLWIILFLGIITVLRFIIITANDDIPSFEELEKPQYNQASVIYDANGVSFGKYYIENRELVSYDDLSPYITEALLATEDIRFEQHSGIDLKALFRVGFKTLLLSKESSGGGSTISQQLAKLLYKRESFRNQSKLQRAIGLVRTKVKEWITAVKLEKSYTKREIMTMYLNKFEFINGAHGIQSAAQTYFKKDQKNLTVDQAALLVGMLKNPSLYNPLRFPENATARRNVVLHQMDKYYDLDDSVDTIYDKIVDMSNFERSAHDVGPAPYFRSELTKWLRDLFNKESIKKADGTEYNIYKDGLKIYTTIDLHYQEHAEKAVKDHLKFLQKRYWEVWKGKDPWTYEADTYQKEIRQTTLDRKVKESERYLNLHNKYLSKIKSVAQKKYSVNKLNENVIKNLIQVKDKKTTLNSLSEENIIRRSNIKNYQKLIEDNDLYNDLKSNYNALQKDYKAIFNTKVKMEVFDYNEDNYKVVEMSPLDSVRYHNQFLQASLLSVHPKTGHIKAWVGGAGFNYFKYDHVNSRRQVGSTIKPFVYATAISLMGISPCQEYEDIQYTIAPGDDNLHVDKEWSPANANEKFTKNMYNLYQGLLYSKNSISVRLVKEMGSVDVIRELLDNAGISKTATYPDGRYVVPRVPSICLGAMDLSLFEMAGAYTVFGNDGIYTKPTFVSHIEDKNGKVIYTGIPESKRAINSLYNGVMVDMLKNNVGGGYGLGVKTDIGGKTGTTNDYADGWFMSVAPELVTGVWVGGDDKWIRFLTLDDGQGFVMARPIVKQYLQEVEKDTATHFNYEAEYPLPPQSIIDLLDCERYKQKSVEEEQNLNKLNIREEAMDEEFEDEFDFDEDLEEFDDEFSDIAPDTIKNTAPSQDTTRRGG
jgi:penicillin-binding protein 1A